MARYVPVLRTKRAEWDALRNLTSDVRQAITPCFEVLPAEIGMSDLRRGFHRFAVKIGRAWGFAPTYVDFSHIGAALRAQGEEHPVTLLGRAATAYGIKPILIVSPHNDSRFQLAARDAVQIHKLHVAVRLHVGDLGKDGSTDGIESLLSNLGVTYSETDLLVDCASVGDTPPDYDWVSSSVPRLTNWRRFIVLGGSFPPDLDGLRPGIRALPRYDWQHWRAWVFGPKPRSARTPDFSDYTIQHAVYAEPPQGANPSASIRYAAEDYWLVVRGEPLRSKKTAGNLQYYGNAQLLSQHDEFRGADYSFGDQYIRNVAERRAGPGTPTTWLIAGINHHITLTARQVQSSV